MNTHLMMGMAVLFGLIGFAASRELLHRLRAQRRPVPVRVPTSGNLPARRPRL